MTTRRTVLALLGTLPFTRPFTRSALAFAESQGDATGSSLPGSLPGSAASSAPGAGDALDEALALLAPYAPSFRGGLSNHGPMAAEALISLGRADAVVEWTTAYRRRLEPRPKPTEKIPATAYQGVLGDSSRTRDWEEFFTNELAESPWRKTLATWIPRLAPGMAAAGLHGVIRVGHAVCAMRAKETPERLDELARALGYWAAEFMTLPGKPAVPGELAPSKALDQVQLLPRDKRRGGGLITHEMSALLDFKPFEAVVNLVNPKAGDPTFITDLLGTFAGLYVNTPSSHFEFLHGVTGAAAVGEILEFIEEKDRPHVFAYTWQVTAGLFARYGTSGLNPQVAKDAAQFKPEDFADLALGIGDDHTIKLVAACKREWTRHPDSRFLAAATRRIERRR